MISRMRHRSRGKGLAWVLVLLLALGAGSAYFVLYPEELPEWAVKTPIGRGLQSTTVYTWRDASGTWQVSDQPPPQGIDYQVEHYARDANVLPLPPELQR